MVSRRTGRTSSNAAKGNSSQVWIRATSTAVGAPGGTARTSTSTSAHDSASFGTAAGPRRVLTTNHLNSNSEPPRPGRLRLRVGTPSLSHRAMSSSEQGTGHTGQLSPDLRHGTYPGTSPGPSPDIDTDIGTDTDLWSSILSPSALLVDAAKLSPPLIANGTDVGDLFDMGLHSPMLIDCPEQPTNANTVGSSHPAAATTPDLFGDIPLALSDANLVPSTHTHTSVFDWSLPSDSNSSASTASHPPTCCFTVALDILTRLFPNAPAGCSLAGSATPGGSSGRGSAESDRGARTIDSVISENKQVIESLTNLLDCHCSQDEYLISIMTLIVLKVMSWYAAAAADDSISPSSPFTTRQHQPRQQPQKSFLTARPGSGLDPGPTASSGSASASPADRTALSSSSSLSLSLSSSSYGSSLGSEQVLRAPATVGNYCVAGHHQGRMAAQLVLSELHRVQRLVNALAKRLESVRLRAAGEAECGSGFSAGSGSLGMESSSGGGGNGGGGNGGGEATNFGVRAAPFSVLTFRRLEEDLRRRLRMLSTETIDVLRRA